MPSIFGALLFSSPSAQFPRRCKNSNYSQRGVMVLCTFFHGFGNNNNKEKKKKLVAPKKEFDGMKRRKKKWGEKTNQQSPNNKQLPLDDMPCIYRAIGDIALTLFSKRLLVEVVWNVISLPNRIFFFILFCFDVFISFFLPFRMVVVVVVGKGCLSLCVCGWDGRFASASLTGSIEYLGGAFDS